jgi:hypothetical protein
MSIARALPKPSRPITYNSHPDRGNDMSSHFLPIREEYIATAPHLFPRNCSSRPTVNTPDSFLCWCSCM